MTPKGPAAKPGESGPLSVRGIAADVARRGIATVLIAVSCSAPGRQPADHQTVRVGGVGGAGGSYGNVAEATPAVIDADDGTIETAEDPKEMPDDPAQISLLFEKSPEVALTLLSGKDFPYPSQITNHGGRTVVTLYLPRGEEISITITSPETGVEDTDPIQLSIDALAKLGTTPVDLSQNGSLIRFLEGAQQALGPGENILQDESTEEFLDGEMRTVLHGIYTAEQDEILNVSWSGAEELYAFANEAPVNHTGPFQLELKQGDTVGFYPVVKADGTSVTLNLSSLDF